jgi:hypothetical protein
VNGTHVIDNPDSRSQWTFVGTFHSAVEDETYPWDLDVVKAIRRDLLPDFVPLVVKTVYRSPSGNDRVWKHHAWGYLVHDPQASWHHVRVLWPANPGAVNYHQGKFSDRLLIPSFGYLGHMGDSLRSPGRIMPIGWNLYQQIDALLNKGNDEDLMGSIDAIEAKYFKDRADVDDLIGHLAEENGRRFAGDPMVAVPTSYGGAA